MEIIISIAAKVAEYTVLPVGHQLGYLFFYTNNVKSLRNEVESLGEASDSVKNSVNEAMRNAEDIDVNVLNWLNIVNEISKEVRTFQEDENEAKKIFCFNLVQLYRLSRKAKKLTKVIVKVKKQGKYERVSHRGSLAGLGSSTIKGYLSFGSRISTLKEIMKTLTDDNTNMVGIYGMGGVGKTMLVKEISRQIREAKLFDEVVLATVTQIPDVRSIQAQLGDMLGLRFEQESIKGRAALLQKRLMKERRILIVLDDVWKSLDLETVGIPEDHQGCKILFTSRDKHVLSNEMSIDINFHVKILSEEESWDFFENIVGESIKSFDLKAIAAHVVKECKGMPIALATLANALKGKPLAIWRDALYQLRNCMTVNIKGMNEEVYSSLELSYRYLKSGEAKLLFLLCGIFPEDYQIRVEDLCIYCMGMGLLHGMDKLAGVRDRVVKLVDDLKSSSLLLQSDEGNDEFVTMHDMVRDVAILIASKDDQLHSICYGQGLDEWNLMDDNYTKMFMTCDNFHKLPLRLMLPKLELLIMSLDPFGKQTFQISEFIFEGMEKLKVLKLTGISMSTLPSSLSHLTNLRTLSLTACVLGNIDIISGLRKHYLSFRGSTIRSLPVGMGQLIQLKMLDLCCCTELEEIPLNLISRLTKLEDLNFLRSFVGWERKDLNNQTKNATISELKHLPLLSTLYLCIPDSDILTKRMFSEKLQLERFKIVIGKRWETYSYQTSRMLDLKVGLRIFLNDWLKTLIKETEELYLEASLGIKDVLSELAGIDYPHCRHLHLGNDVDIHYFISESDELLFKVFNILESLSLSRMMSLENILTAHLKVVPFRQLTVIKVVECNKLRNLFFFSVMKELSNLEMIKVYNCEIMEEIVAVESEEATHKFECSRLRSLYLGGLPRLTSFCSKVVRHESSFNCSKHAEVLVEDKLDNLMPFFNDQVAFPTLRNLIIKGTNEWKLIWHNRLELFHCFCKLKMIDLADCTSLVKVFPSNMFRVLQSLEVLNIQRCNLLEEIFEIQDLDIKENGNIVAAQLRCLELYDLPNLKLVWSKDPKGVVTFQNLQQVNVIACPKLKNLFPASFTQDLKQLQSLEMRNSGSEEIFGKEEICKTTTESGFFHFKKQCFKMSPTCHDLDQFVEGAKGCDRLNLLVSKVSSFRNLCTLRITECDGLTNLLSSSMVKSLVQLQRLSLSKCKRMITVFAETETKGGEEEETEVVFRKLEFLGLFDLSKLTAFQSGKCSSRFPCLKTVVMKRCPEMKKFSLGIVSTPKLENVKLTDADEYDWWYPFPNIQSEKFWAADINATIQYLWENDSSSSVQHLFT